jgi:uncharacterized protein (TIGR02996 family)
MHPADAAFLRAIIEQPDDDLPRLVYADYLDERGDCARAEFIRVQCELAKPSGDPSGHDALAEREQELLRRHSAAWVGPLGRLLDSSWFHRGFIEHIQLDVRHFVELADQIFAALPVRWVDCYGPPFFEPWSKGRNWATALSTCPFLTRPTRLGLFNIDLSSDAPTLLGAPLLRSLAVLHLDRCRLGDNDLRILAGATPPGRLSSLIVNSNRSGPCITASGTRALATSPLLRQLTELDLSVNQIGPAGVAALADSPQTAGLVSLDLSANHLGDAGVAAIAGSPHLSGVQSLGIGRNGVTDAGVEALLLSPHLTHLSSLDLSENDLSAHAVSALAESPNMSSLTSLDVRGTHLSPDTIRAVALSPFLTNLAEMRVYDEDLGEASERALQAFPHLVAILHVYDVTSGVE